MLPDQLDKVIYEFLSDEGLKDSDLRVLRDKLNKLGFTDVPKDEIKVEVELKQTFQKNRN